MSNSRVESHNRAELRNRIISAATLLEILLSGLVLIGLLLSMIPLLQWMPGLLFDGNDVEVSIFLQRALDIVIGIGAHLPDGHPAPDLTPSQSGIPEDEFAARLRKHLSSKSAEREETIAIEDPEYEDNTETLLESDAE